MAPPHGASPDCASGVGGWFAWLSAGARRGARDAMGLGKGAHGGGEGHRGTLALYLSSISSSRTLLDIVAILTPFFILMRLILRLRGPLTRGRWWCSRRRLVGALLPARARATEASSVSMRARFAAASCRRSRRAGEEAVHEAGHHQHVRGQADHLAIWYDGNGVLVAERGTSGGCAHGAPWRRHRQRHRRRRRGTARRWRRERAARRRR